MGKPKVEVDEDEEPVVQKPPEGPLAKQAKILAGLEEYWRGVEEELINKYEKTSGLSKKNFNKMVEDLTKKFHTRDPCIQVDEIIECYKRATDLGFPTTKCEPLIDKFNQCLNEFKEEMINKLAAGKPLPPKK